MTLMVVRIVTLNQYGVIWKKIIVVAAMLLGVKKIESCRFIRRAERESDIFRDSRSNLEVQHMVRIQDCTISHGECRA